jgi:hypothetical protein
MPFSNYVAYFDESGDHGLVNIDPTFPVFVLCGVVFEISDYLNHDKPAFGQIKFDHFGHDAVIFHSREIRKRLGPFQILTNTATRNAFMTDITDFYNASRGTIIAAGIDKNRHVAQYRFPIDPYSISLLFCLERLYGFLVDRGHENNGTLTCVFEKRGPAEDKQLAAEFLHICNGNNRWGQLPFTAVFADKLTNMIGLQVADLAAYPIARRIMNPRTANPAFRAIRRRFRRSDGGRINGYGLKVFP